MRLTVHKIPWYLSWKGLLLSKQESVVFRTRFGIHTFGLTYPITVVILDKDSVIRKIKHNLQPNRLFFWNPVFDTVLELPNGSVTVKKLQVGEKIDLRSF